MGSRRNRLFRKGGDVLLIFGSIIGFSGLDKLEDHQGKYGTKELLGDTSVFKGTLLESTEYYFQKGKNTFLFFDCSGVCMDPKLNAQSDC